VLVSRARMGDVDYETRTGRLSGKEAAGQIVLPIAAAAVGMTAIAIVFYIAAHSAQQRRVPASPNELKVKHRPRK
jgi:hypothetical protein